MFSASNTGWIGIDLGCSAVKIAQVRKRRGGYLLGDAVVIRRESSWKFSDWRNLDDFSNVAQLRFRAMAGRRAIWSRSHSR